MAENRLVSPGYKKENPKSKGNQQRWASPRKFENKKQANEIYVPKTKFYIPYPDEKDFAVQAISSREAELTKKDGKPSKVFGVGEFSGLSFEQISQAVVLQATITRVPIGASKIEAKECVIKFSGESSVTIKTPDTENIFKYRKGEKGDFGYYSADEKEKADIPETESPSKFSISRKFSHSNELEKPLKQLEEALKKNDLSSQEKLSRALESLGKNATLAHIKTKYSDQKLTPTYALYCLEQELQLIKKQIKAYDNATKELGSRLENPSRGDTTPAQNFINNTRKAIEAFKDEIPEMVKDFQSQFKPIVNDVNAVEKFQTNKKVGELVFAEKFPAIEKFKSQILTEAELLEVMGDKRLSGQQADLLRQIEDVIMHDNTRSKVRGLLDTGMGKTFLAEKIAKYSEILKRENRKLPKNFPRIASFKIKNIDLASQDQLSEMESRTNNDNNPLKGNLIIVDEDFFISNKSLRTLVDKGAKVVRFGASENQLQLIEAFHRAEEKNIAGAKIKNNEALIEMLESKKEENSELVAIYDKLKGSYKRYSENGGASYMLQNFNREDFVEAVNDLKKKNLIKIDEVEKCLEKIQGNNFNVRRKSILFDQASTNAETQIQDVINAVRFVSQIEISRAFSQVNNATNVDEFKSAYEDLKRFGVFEDFDQEINEFLSEDIKSKNIDDLKKNALPAIKYAAEKKMLLLNGLESNANTKVSEDVVYREFENINYLNEINKEIDAEISKIRTTNESLREPNRIFDSKARIRENDVKAVAERRILAKEKLKKAEVKSEIEDNKTWYELAAENSSSNKSQNIFPGISLNEGEIKTGLEAILAQTKKDVAVANFVEDGQHKIILAKKNARGAVEYKTIANDGNKDAEIEKLTQGTKSSVMIYAGENLEFVVGGDYGHLSVLDKGDQQNIFIKREKDLNIDLFKQMFGRDRSGFEDISRKVTLIGEVAKTEEAAKLADKSFANSQEKDLTEIVRFLQTKLGKYYKSDEKSQELFDAISKNGNEKDLAALIIDKRTLTNQVNPQLDFLKEGVDQEKFRRDLKAFAFYSLASRAIKQETNLRDAFAETSLEGFAVSPKLKSLMETKDAVKTLDNLEVFSELLHLKKESKLEIKSEKLDNLKEEALAPKRASLLKEAVKIQTSIKDYATKNPRIVENLSDYKIASPTLVNFTRDKDNKVDGFVFDHGEKEGQKSYKFAQDGIHLSGEKEPLSLKEAQKLGNDLEESLSKMRDLFEERQAAEMKAIADSAQKLHDDLKVIANSELKTHFAGRFVVANPVIIFDVGVDNEYNHGADKGKYEFKFNSEENVIGLGKFFRDNKNVAKLAPLNLSQIEKLQSHLTAATEIAQKALDIKQVERAKIEQEAKSREQEAKLRADEIEKVRLQELEAQEKSRIEELKVQEKLRIEEISAQARAANELRAILKTASGENSSLKIKKTRDQKNFRSFSIKNGEEVLKYKFIFHPTEPKVLGLIKLPEKKEQSSQEIKSVQEIVKAELERAKEAAEIKKMSESEAETKAKIAEDKAVEQAKAEAIVKEIARKTRDLRAVFKSEFNLELSGITNVVKGEKEVKSFSLMQGDKKCDYQVILSGSNQEPVGVRNGEKDLNIDEIDEITKAIEAKIAEANAKKLEAENVKKLEAKKLEAENAKKLEAENAKIAEANAKKIEAEKLEAEKAEKLEAENAKKLESEKLEAENAKIAEANAKKLEAEKEVEKANAKKLEAEKAAKTADLIAKQAATTSEYIIAQAARGVVIKAQSKEIVGNIFNNVTRKLIDEESTTRSEQKKSKPEKVELVEPKLKAVEEQKGREEIEATQSILKMLKDKAYLNKYLSSKYNSKLIDVDVAPRGFFDEDPMSFTVNGEENFAGKYEFSNVKGVISLSKNNQPQTLEEITAVKKIIEGEISKAVEVEKAEYAKAKEVRDSAAGELTLEEKKVLLEHELNAIKKSHQPLTDSEVASKIDLIAKNDLHNLAESKKPEESRKTEFFNSDKVMRTLAKVHAISELQGGEMDLEKWKKVWGLDKSLNLDLTRADKSILAMLGMNDAGVTEVFGSIKNPKLVLNAIDDIKLENIMNVASKLIDAIGSDELKKYSGKEVEINGVKKIISEKLEKGVAGRSLSFSLEAEEKLEVKPHSSVEKPQAWKVSLIDKSRTIKKMGG